MCAAILITQIIGYGIWIALDTDSVEDPEKAGINSALVSATKWMTLWLPCFFLLADALLLLAAVIRINLLLKLQPELRMNERHMTIHVVVIFLLIASVVTKNIW